MHVCLYVQVLLEEDQSLPLCPKELEDALLDSFVSEELGDIGDISYQLTDACNIKVLTQFNNGHFSHINQVKSLCEKNLVLVKIATMLTVTGCAVQQWCGWRRECRLDSCCAHRQELHTPGQ